MEILRKLALSILLFSLALSCFANVNSDEPITFDQLPQTAQLWIRENFANLTVTRASYDMHKTNKNYEVTLSDNTIVEFEEMGKWTSIQNRESSVPEQFIPIPIRQFLTAQYTMDMPIKIEAINNEYNIYLSSHTVLCFDSNCHHISTDGDLDSIVTD